MRHRFRHHGFPILVVMGLMAAAYLAASTTVPHPVPAFALQAGPVYRLEVGAACFVVFYLAAMALILALDGRGFAELGTKGLKAVKVVRTTDNQAVDLSEHTKLVRNLARDLQDNEAALRTAAETLNEQDKRLARLERSS